MDRGKALAAFWLVKLTANQNFEFLKINMVKAYKNNIDPDDVLASEEEESHLVV